MKFTVGSVCSGIEAAAVAWNPIGMEFLWCSETGKSQSALLAKKYPDVKNCGDMLLLPDMIKNNEIPPVDIVCGGTPCQDFSLAGKRLGLSGERGILTLGFIHIVDENDNKRKELNMPPGIAFWENVEGVLCDKSNAFGMFISKLAGLKEIIQKKRWPNSGMLTGPKRKVAWRVMDAKYFGIPQQRKRVYLFAYDRDENLEAALFEMNAKSMEMPDLTKEICLAFEKDGHQFETFRAYTDCLYAAYGTKWNGNAAAYNGSLFVLQDGQLRRFSPNEAELLMGFPAGYTDMGFSNTERYRMIGNSWAIPVITYIGKRLMEKQAICINADFTSAIQYQKSEDYEYLGFKKPLISQNGYVLNV